MIAPERTSQAGRQLFGVRLYVYQFLTSNSNFKKHLKSPKFSISFTFTTESFEKNYTQKPQKIYKTAQNVDKWDEQRGFWLLKQEASL